MSNASVRNNPARPGGPTVLGLITARGGTKGVPRKNVRSIAGKPLIAWTIDAAQAARRVSRLIVSTEDGDIARLCRDRGVEAPFERPAELASDEAGHVDVVIHALDWLDDHEGYRPDWVLLLQPTSPLRTARDIDAAVDLAVKKNADALVSVTRARDHPYLVRRWRPDGALEPFVDRELTDSRRQALPPAYALNGAIYLCRPQRLVTLRRFEGPGCIAFEMPAERSLDIDTLWDWNLAEWALQRAGTGPTAKHEPAPVESVPRLPPVQFG
jgi:CMP-N-acetylneuraminic acid synthetase